ncbi:MAG: sigma-54-dependent Fis family transcriptional regulator [Acidobacteria bacterium]|nr:sigma-54-dependent Fis family transcriptional regulator [Acidobacteriota bacterium]
MMKLVTTSPAMQRIAELVERVAQTDSSVLLLGESGTGKDAFARCIHDLSPRRNQPFVKIDGAALPEDLFESEVFGFEKGAFTGAIESKPGRFEAANGGTLVLDEISNLSLAAQAKLLRVIEERSFERLGGKQAIKIDVRIIALANVDMKEAVRAHTFRNDLYYRLAVVAIELPRLLDRSEDIPVLAEQFVKQFAARNGRTGVQLAKTTLELLLDYDFPGNVRELRNIIERAVLGTNREIIEPEHLPDYLRSANRLMQSRLHKPSLAELEAVYIREVLEYVRGNKTRAAEILGISRKNLYEKMHRYKINLSRAQSVESLCE